jgi:hypothetical protein
MAIGIEHIAPLLPEDWPGRVLSPPPGDLSRFMTGGFGGGVPVVVRPWDKLEDAFQQRGYYGLDAPTGNPIHAAPTSDPAGGAIYFDDGVPGQDVLTALQVMGAHLKLDDYVIFGRESAEPQTDRYLDQIRIIGPGALQQLFGARPEEAAAHARPKATLGALVAGFIEAQQAKWNGANQPFARSLAGTLGGDGDWAKESLAFGFLVENQYWQVMRLWSRPWLVTK